MNLPFSWLSIAGAASALSYGLLAIWSDQALGFWQFFLPFAFAGLIVFASWAWFCHTDKQPLLWELLFWAVVFRFTGILGLPLLEDDHYRYLWDGFMLIEQGSPYGVAPEFFFAADLSALTANINLAERLEGLLDSINHPHIATIYGPLCQWMFGLAYLIAPTEVWPLQLIFAGFDLGIILLLSRHVSPRNLLLYAWCPLLIKEFAFTAHTDVMAVFFVLAACLARQRGHRCWTGVLAAMAIASKVFAIVLVPLLLIKSLRSSVTFSLAMLALYLPFISDMFNANHGLGAMASGWFFNAPIYTLMADHEWLVKILLGGSFTLFWLYYGWHWVRRTNGPEIPRGDWLFGAFLLILPAVNPWYVVWVLPFATIWLSSAPWVASVAILLAYASGLTLPGSSLAVYQIPLWALALEYGLIYSAITFDLYRFKQKSASFSTIQSPASTSINSQD